MNPNQQQNLLFLSKTIQSAEEQIPTDIKDQISRALKPIGELIHIQLVTQQRNQNVKFDYFEDSSLKLLQNKIQTSLSAIQSSFASHKQEESQLLLIECIKLIYQQQIFVEQKQSLQNECKKTQEEINNLFISKIQQITEENHSEMMALTEKQAQEAKNQKEQFEKFQIAKKSDKQKIQQFQTLRKNLATFQPLNPQKGSDNSFQVNNQKPASSAPLKNNTETKPTVNLPPQRSPTQKYKSVIFVEKKDNENQQFKEIIRYQHCSYSQFGQSIFGLSPKNFLKELNANMKGYSMNEVDNLIIILPNYIDKKLSDEHNSELLTLQKKIKLIKPQILTIVDEHQNQELCREIQRGLGNSQKTKLLIKLTERDISEAGKEQMIQNQMKKDQIKEQLLEQQRIVLQKQAQYLKNERIQQLQFEKQGKELNKHLNNFQQNLQRVDELQQQISEIENSNQPHKQDIQLLQKKFQDDQNQSIEELKQAQMDKINNFQRVSDNLNKCLNDVQIDSNLSEPYFSQLQDLKNTFERRELQLQNVLFLVDQEDCVGLLLKLSKNLEIITSDESQSIDSIIKGLMDKLIVPTQQPSQENPVEKLKTSKLSYFISPEIEAKAPQDTELSSSFKFYAETFQLQNYFNSFSKDCNNKEERIKKAQDILESWLDEGKPDE